MSDKKFSGAVIRRALGNELGLGIIINDFSDWTIYEKDRSISLIKFTHKTQDGYRLSFDAEQLKLEEEKIKNAFQELYINNIPSDQDITFFLALKEKDKYAFKILNVSGKTLQKVAKIKTEDAGAKRGFNIKETDTEYQVSLYPYPESYAKVRISGEEIVLDVAALEEAKIVYKEENHPLVDWTRLFSRSYDKKVAYDDYNKSKEEYRSEFENICPPDKFKEIFFKNSRTCVYCGIEEEELDSLSTKRAGRGKRLEYDRKADIDYEIDNIVLACYWCNNAKTDTFSVQQFKGIAKAMNCIWKDAGANIKDFNKIKFWGNIEDICSY